MKKTHRILSLVVTFCMLFTSFSGINISAETKNEDVYEAVSFSNLGDDEVALESELVKTSTILSKEELPTFIDYETALKFGHTKRLFDEEQSLDSVLFENLDGTRTLYIFDMPIKHIDDNGNICDISHSSSTNLIANENYDLEANVILKEMTLDGILLKFDFSKIAYISVASQINDARIVIKNASNLNAGYLLSNDSIAESLQKTSSADAFKETNAESGDLSFVATDFIRGLLDSTYSSDTSFLIAKNSGSSSSLATQSITSQTNQSGAAVLVVNYDTMLLEDGARHYFNNDQTGKYLKNEWTQPIGISGYVDDIGTSIEWVANYISDGKYTLQSVSDDFLYLTVPLNEESSSVQLEIMAGSTPHARYQWEVLPGGSGYGGVRFVNAYNNRILYSDGTQISTQPNDSTNYENKVWKAFDIDYYGDSYMASRELQSFSVSYLSFDMGEIGAPSISKTPSNAFWTTAKDFSYTVSDYYEVDSGYFLPMESGIVSVTATHKATGLSDTFTVSIQDYLVTQEVLIGSSVNIKSTVGHYAGILNGATWSSSDTAVATVNTSGKVTGVTSGYVFIFAKNADGKVLLACELKVMDERTQTLQTFTQNEINYLYCPSTALRIWTEDLGLEEGFALRVAIINALRPLYLNNSTPNPSAAEIKEALLEADVVSISDYNARRLFVECFDGYRGLYNADFLTEARLEYLNYLKELVISCAFSMAANIDPVNTGSTYYGMTEFQDDLASIWTNNKESDNIMLGTSYGGRYYYKVADEMGYKYFYAREYDYYRIIYGDDFVQAVNRAFLQKGIQQGCTFYFSHNPESYKLGSLYKEYQYLVNYYSGLGKTVSYREVAENIWKLIIT